MSFDKYFQEVWGFFDDKEHETAEECLLCGNMNPLMPSKYGYLKECDDCGFTYLWQQPTQKALDEFYKTSDAMKTWSVIKSNGSDDHRQNDKFDYFWDFIENNKVRSVLDVGCGSGYFLNRVPPGVSTMGVEPHEPSAKLCNFNVVPDLASVGSYKFEAITAFGVLEHVKDPKGFINECLTYLDENGYFGVIVPNIGGLAIRTLKQSCCTICPQHLWYFDVDSLVRLFSDCGLSLQSFTTKEAEIQPILRTRYGYDPYEKFGSFKFKEDADINEENILKHNLGMKILAIFKRS